MRLITALLFNVPFGISVIAGLGLLGTSFRNKDTDGVWDAGVQTLDDALQLLL